MRVATDNYAIQILKKPEVFSMTKTGKSSFAIVLKHLLKFFSLFTLFKAVHFNEFESDTMSMFAIIDYFFL